MKFFDKVFGKIETDDEFEEEEIDQKPQSTPDPKPHEIATERMKSIQQEEIMNRNTTGNSPHGSNVVNFHAPNQTPTERVKVIVIEPKNMDDAQQAANYLDEKRPVILNFERTQSDEARRILDFISGTIYAISGEITNIGSNVFLCAPQNVTVAQADGDKRIGDVNWMSGNKSNG